MVLPNYFCWPWYLRDCLCDPFSCPTTQHSLLSSVCPSIPLQLMYFFHSYTSVLWTTDLSSRLVESFLERRQGKDCSTLLGRSSLSPDCLPRQFQTLLCWSVLHTLSRFPLPVASQLARIRWASYGFGPQWNGGQKSRSATQSLQ